jgi:hypothetical protein
MLEKKRFQNVGQAEQPDRPVRLESLTYKVPKPLLSRQVSALSQKLRSRRSVVSAVAFLLGKQEIASPTGM